MRFVKPLDTTSGPSLLFRQAAHPSGLSYCVISNTVPMPSTPPIAVVP